MRSDLGALREERSSEYVFCPANAVPPLAPLTEAGQRAAEKAVRVASRVIPDGGGPLFGGAWCVADTDLAMMLWRLWKTGYALPEKLRAFAAAEWEREAVREFVAMERPLEFVAY